MNWHARYDYAAGLVAFNSVFQVLFIASTHGSFWLCCRRWSIEDVVVDIRMSQIAESSSSILDTVPAGMLTRFAGARQGRACIRRALCLPSSR